jgi:hypothetical protein
LTCALFRNVSIKIVRVEVEVEIFFVSCSFCENVSSQRYTSTLSSQDGQHFSLFVPCFHAQYEVINFAPAKQWAAVSRNIFCKLLFLWECLVTALHFNSFFSNFPTQLFREHINQAESQFRGEYYYSFINFFRTT